MRGMPLNDSCCFSRFWDVLGQFCNSSRLAHAVYACRIFLCNLYSMAFFLAVLGTRYFFGFECGQAEVIDVKIKS